MTESKGKYFYKKCTRYIFLHLLVRRFKTYFSKPVKVWFNVFFILFLNLRNFNKIFAKKAQNIVTTFSELVFVIPLPQEKYK